MSTSVTRSMVPFLLTRRSPPKCASWTLPASSAASIAVASKIGGCVSGTAAGQLLHHAHLHAPFGRAPQRDIVHEATHEEDATAAGFQEVLGCQRVGDLFGFEALALVEDAHDELAGIADRDE